MSTTVHTNPLDLSDADFLQRAQAMCRTKAAYCSRAEAVAFTRRRGYAETAYSCPWCYQWHLTSYDRARSKAFQRRLKRLLRQ